MGDRESGNCQCQSPREERHNSARSTKEATHLIPAFRKQRQANLWNFKARLIYITEQPRLLSAAPAGGGREAEGPTILLLAKDQHRGSRAAGLHSSSHRGAKKPYRSPRCVQVDIPS